VAADLASRGWQLKRVMTDNAQELRSATFQATIAKLKALQAFIRAGRRRSMAVWSESSRPYWTSAESSSSSLNQGAVPSIMQRRTAGRFIGSRWNRVGGIDELGGQSHL
jgi:hypothetical protein